ncbi:alpha/beta fold hydrolase [Mariniflexile sp. HMF6888]|uniref:alpha/beta fold hydrolase n=1 Tax=Mariniflexile sp. HMF6888 TaxID=3373086 RepID=UPI0037B5E2A7
MKRNLIVLIILGILLGQCNTEKLRIEEGYKEVNGVKHYYKIIGEGEPFIILHGGPGMYHDELYPFFLDFARENKIIFYDQRGNGKSLLEKIDSTTFNVELLVDDLEELRKVFGIENLNIIGHSWGGLLAMYYGVEYPENIKRLILVDAAPVNTELLIACYKKQISMFKPEEWEYVQKLWESKEYLEGDPEIHNEAMRISEGTVFSNKSVIDDYMKVAAFDEVTAKNAVALNDLATQIKLNIHVQDKLSNIKCPTLIINGKDDFIVEEAVQLANTLIVNSEVVYIENAGHYPYIENKKAFFEELNKFIERTTHNNVYTK